MAVRLFCLMPATHEPRLRFQATQLQSSCIVQVAHSGCYKTIDRLPFQIFIQPVLPKCSKYCPSINMRIELKTKNWFNCEPWKRMHIDLLPLRKWREDGASQCSLLAGYRALGELLAHLHESACHLADFSFQLWSCSIVKLFHEAGKAFFISQQNKIHLFP